MKEITLACLCDIFKICLLGRRRWSKPPGCNFIFLLKNLLPKR